MIDKNWTNYGDESKREVRLYHNSRLSWNLSENGSVYLDIGIDSYTDWYFWELRLYLWFKVIIKHKWKLETAYRDRTGLEPKVQEEWKIAIGLIIPTSL